MKVKGKKKGAGKGLVKAQKGQPKKDIFLKFYSMMGNMRHAALKADVARSAVYKWIEKDEEFVKAMELAGEEAVNSLEQEAFRRAVQGIDEPVVWQGERCYERNEKGEKIPLFIKKYDTALLIFLLKGHNPKKYRDRQIELIGAGGGPIQIEDKTIKEPDQIANILQILISSGEVKPNALQIGDAEDE